MNGVGQPCEGELHARLDGEGLETEQPPPRQPFTRQVANVLNCLPKSVQAGARRALNEIAQAEDQTHAERAIEALVSDYGAKWPKAVAKVTDDRDALLTFFFPADHWLHLRTTNPTQCVAGSPIWGEYVNKGHDILDSPISGEP